MAENLITNLVDMVPISDDLLHIGHSDLRFKNGYFSGVLSDGTNSISIADIVSAGGGTWGSISGTLSNQTDLQTALDAKQPLDADLTSIALLGTAANKMLYTTEIDTWAEASLTTAGRALLDDANAAAQATTLGLGTGDSPTFAGLNLGTDGAGESNAYLYSATAGGYMRLYTAASGVYLTTVGTSFDLLMNSAGYVQIRTGAGESVYFDAGGNWAFRDTDNAYAQVGYIETATGYLHFPRLYLNSTVYLDGATAGQTNITGNLVFDVVGRILENCTTYGGGNETPRVMLPFFMNDLAYNNLKGGSTTLDPSGGDADRLFNGQMNVVSWVNPTGTITVEVTFWQAFGYGLIVGFTQSTSYRAKDFIIELWNSSTSAWVQVANVTDWTKGVYSGTPYVSGNVVTKMRISFSNFQSASYFQLSQIFLIYGPNPLMGKSYTLGLDGGSLYGHLLPGTDSTYNLGSSTPFYWANAYIDRLYLNSTAYLDGATAGRIALTGDINHLSITDNGSKVTLARVA